MYTPPILPEQYPGLEPLALATPPVAYPRYMTAALQAYCSLIESFPAASQLAPVDTALGMYIPAHAGACVCPGVAGQRQFTRIADAGLRGRAVHLVILVGLHANNTSSTW